LEKTVTIKSDDIAIAISTKGAELQSVTGKGGTQFLWHGDEKFWTGRSPLLFPICGALKDDKYIFNNTEYHLKKHGFAMNCIFSVEDITDDKAVFLHQSNDETLKDFPFNYRLWVIYTLRGNTLNVEYKVENASDKTMYFSIGAHEGYYCPEGIEQYSIIFEQPETLKNCVLENHLLTGETTTILENDTVLNLNYEYYKTIDTLVFKNLNSKSVTIKHKNSKKQATINFDGFPYLLFWTIPNAPYLCIEPWCGIPDSSDTDYDITKKEGILTLKAGEKLTKTHTVSFSE